MKKTLFTLCVDNYEPEITAITFPLLKRFADKIDADFQIITEREFPDMPVTYEKFQLYELSKGLDWAYFLDADTLVHPDAFDPIIGLEKDTTCSGFTNDFTPMRFKLDGMFRRDGRFIGKGNWCAIFSDWCRDYFHPLDDLTVDEAVGNIYPLVGEESNGTDSIHLIDDYIVSRNIARYGLKHVLISQIAEHFKFQQWHPRSVIDPSQLVLYPFAHTYNMPSEQKVVWMGEVLKSWGIK